MACQMIDFAPVRISASKMPQMGKDNELDNNEDQVSEARTVKKWKKSSARRCKLEYDVIKLRMELQDEMDLHEIFENASDHAIGVLAELPAHLPVSAQKLLLDVASLEFAVCRLEEQMASLQWQILTERLQRKTYEQATLLRFLEENSTCSRTETLQTENEEDEEPSALISKYSLPQKNDQPPSPIQPASPDNVFQGHREHVFMSSSSSTELPNPYGLNRPGDSDNLTEVTQRSSEDKRPSCPSFEKWESRGHVGVTCTRASEPNRISEKMVQCMIDIYQHLSDGHCNPLASDDSSIPSTSASSFLSFARSPLVDLRTTDPHGVFDPYATQDKLPWPDLGPYARAVQVCWMLVGKEQLDYAADALLRFKHLVEELSRVDPSTMAHVEKLAFWINVYNALMMHAFLAYGTPNSEVKYYSLMQKANYTFEGHSFNALTIEVALLKSQRAIHRHQHRPSLFGRIKLSEQQKKFAISHPEPLVTFALSFGAWSCPAVRVYTPDKVHEQLDSSFQNYLQASVGISRRGKLLVPRLLYSHARDAYVASVPDWICERLTKSQQEFAQGCLRQRTNRYLSFNKFAVVPFDARFRYLFLPAAAV